MTERALTKAQLEYVKSLAPRCAVIRTDNGPIYIVPKELGLMAPPSMVSLDLFAALQKDKAT